jgi:4-diphosphocytidyl-2-C-methyl-D-erythritol kinase
MRTITIPAFAKVNLQLHIVGKRPDGYHELRTTFQTISLHDRLTLTLTHNRARSLDCSDPALPSGSHNLVWRAFDALRRELRLKAGVHAHLDKWIPAAAGLGGGSSDAAATLVGLLRLVRAGAAPVSAASARAARILPNARLLEIAASLGADVPFFLLGGRALGVNRGDEIYPLGDIPTQSVLVVSPSGISVPTTDAFAWASRRLTKAAAPPTLLRFCALCWSSQGGPLCNDFEPPVFAKHPRLGRIKRGLLQAGATDAALAGSGSAVYGFFRNPAQARRAAMLFPNDQVFLAETVSRTRYRKALGLSLLDD